MMKKRSQLTLKGLIELVAIAVVILFLVYTAVSKGSGEAFFKERSAKELALLINTLCGLPGNAEIIFPTDLSRLKIEIKDNFVYIYNKRFAENAKDPTAGKYGISKPNCIEASYIEKPKTFIVKKQGNKINFIEGLKLTVEWFKENV